MVGGDRQPTTKDERRLARRLLSFATERVRRKRWMPGGGKWERRGRLGEKLTRESS